MEQKVINWVQCDNRIKEYNEIVKKIKEERDNIGETMISEVNNSELSKNLPTYNITHMKTSLSFQKSNTYENYTNKFYVDCFTEFLGDSTKATELLEFMKKKRKVENKVILKRNYLMD
mgnify:CR=1 FL=1